MHPSLLLLPLFAVACSSALRMSSTPYDGLLTPVAPFLDKVTDFVLSRTEIPLADMQIDHICYRCATIDEYKSVCRALLDEHSGTLLVEGMIGGRPISTIALKNPIVHKGWSIPCVEVPCPKPGRAYASGLEHIEAVIGDSSSSPHNSKAALELFIARYTTPQVAFDTRAMDKEMNADVSLVVDASSSIKFHLCPLALVCKQEKSHGLVEPVPSDYFK